jgi:hypothetical protein
MGVRAYRRHPLSFRGSSRYVKVPRDGNGSALGSLSLRLLPASAVTRCFIGDVGGGGGGRESREEQSRDAASSSARSVRRNFLLEASWGTARGRFVGSPRDSRDRSAERSVEEIPRMEFLATA